MSEPLPMAAELAAEISDARFEAGPNVLDDRDIAAIIEARIRPLVAENERLNRIASYLEPTPGQTVGGGEVDRIKAVLHILDARLQGALAERNAAREEIARYMADPDGAKLEWVRELDRAMCQLEVEHWAVKAIVLSLYETLNGAPNFATLQCGVPSRPEEKLCVTIQRCPGKTPAQVLCELSDLLRECRYWIGDNCGSQPPELYGKINAALAVQDRIDADEAAAKPAA